MYQNPWLDYTGTGNPYAGITTLDTGNVPPAATGTGGKKFDPEKLKKLAPIAAMIVSYLAGGKDYGGISAGSTAQTLNFLAQQEEERKRYEAEREAEGQRYEAERERQAWLDQITKDELDRQEAQRLRDEEFAQWLGGELGAASEGTPGTEGTPAIPGTPAQDAYTHPLNRPEFVKNLPPEDQAFAGAGQNRPAVAAAPGTPATPGTPGTPGDPMAQFWADAVRESGGDPAIIQGALQYYQASKQPKQLQQPGIDWSGYQRRLSPENPYSTLPPEAFSDQAIRKSAEEIENGLRPPTEKDRLEIERIKAQIAASNRSNRGAGAKPEDEAKVKAAKQKSNYEAFASVLGMYKQPDRDAVADLKRYRAQLINIIGVAYYNELLSAAQKYEGVGAELKTGAQFQPGQGSPIRKVLENLGML